MQTLELLDRLIAFPTISNDSNLALIDFVGDYLRRHGFECRVVGDETSAKSSLFASIGPKDDNGIVLSGHTDVVPTAGQAWHRPPFRLTREGARLFGRGTTDMKGFLACMLSAAARLEPQGLARPLHLAFSYDEEIGCVGVRPLLDRLAADGLKASLCIVGEPTSMQIVAAHKGKISARAHCHGLAGHSSMAPHYLNAIHLAVDFVQRLRACQQEIEISGPHTPGYDVPYTTLHAGRISGGEALNVVADSAYVDFEIRSLPTDDPRAILGRLEEQAAAIAENHRPRFARAGIEIEIRNAYPGLHLPTDDPILAYAAGLTDEPGIGKVSFGTEAGLFAEKLGMPTIVLGPGSMAQGHTTDEYIAVEQLERCDAMLDRLLADLSRS